LQLVGRARRREHRLRFRDVRPTPVMSEIVYAKLAAISEGAALATARLW
jgi:hypothetical protein